MKLGTQLGQKAKAVLECLRKNGKLNRLDLEMKLNIGPLSKTINGMYAMHYIKQFGGKLAFTKSQKWAGLPWAKTWR
jgi:carbon monoxide dehydrogenase subunit G